MKYFILLICLLLSFTSADAFMLIGGRPAAEGEEEAYCSGSEQFCEDFEGADTVWDATSDALDCDGYDTDGDYCDDDTNAPNPKVGSEGYGVMGNFSKYCGEAYSGSGQFYVELWLQSSEVTGAGFILILDSTNSTKVLSLDGDSDDTLLIKVNDNGTIIDTADTILNSTWYHIGVYYYEEQGVDDGVVTVWMNTDGTDFDAGDVISTGSAYDTGTTDAGYIRLRGPVGGKINYIDNIQMVNGAPSWPDS